jgi:hypothetical protein
MPERIRGGDCRHGVANPHRIAVLTAHGRHLVGLVGDGCDPVSAGHS